MREDELEKNLQPFLAYLAQTPVNELLNDYLDVPVWLTVPTSGILHAVC